MSENSIEVEGPLINQFPELQDPKFRLRQTIENNDWHNHDVVYAHSINVYKKLQKGLELGFISDDDTKARLNEQLSSKVGKITRREILLIAGLFHDVGKPDTIVKNENGQDSCPNHEAKGAEVTRIILKNHDFDEADISRVCTLIAYHGLPHGIANPSLSEESKQKMIAAAKDPKLCPGQPDVFPELMLLGLADTQGSQLQDKNMAEFAARVEKYYQLLAEPQKA